MDDLLDLIPSYGPDGEPLHSEKAWTLGKTPASKEIDYSRTPDELILEGKAILKGGRRIFWK